MSDKLVSDDLVHAVREFIKPDGVTWFRGIKEEHGTVDAVFNEHYTGRDPTTGTPGLLKKIRHVVAWREGMTVRNFMRDSGLCNGWTQQDLVDLWAVAVDKAIS